MAKEADFKRNCLIRIFKVYSEENEELNNEKAIESALDKHIFKENVVMIKNGFIKGNDI